MRKFYSAILVVSMALCFQHQVNAQEYIKFKYIDDQIIISAALDGSQTLNFIFDTGVSSDLILDKSMADEFGIEFQDSGNEIRTASGIFKRRISKGHSLNFGSYTVKNLTIDQADLSLLNKTSELPLHGAIGIAFLTQHPFQLDFDQSQLILYTNNHYDKPEKSSSLTHPMTGIIPYRFIMRAQISLLNDLTLNKSLVVDTGARLSTLLYDFKNNGSTWEAGLDSIGTKSFSGAMSGKTETTVGKTRAIAFGSFSFDQMPLYIKKPKDPDLSMGDGLIGIQLINQFNVLFDYKRKVMYWEPNKNFRGNQ